MLIKGFLEAFQGLLIRLLSAEHYKTYFGNLWTQADEHDTEILKDIANEYDARPISFHGLGLLDISQTLNKRNVIDHYGVCAKAIILGWCHLDEPIMGLLQKTINDKRLLSELTIKGHLKA